MNRSEVPEANTINKTPVKIPGFAIDLTSPEAGLLFSEF